MVESETDSAALDLSNWNKFGVGSVTISLWGGKVRDDGPIADRNDTHSWVAVGVAVGTQLFQMARLLAYGGFLGKFAGCCGVEIFVGLDETARRNGLYGYNGLLIGAAFATFGVVSDAPLQPLSWGLFTLAFAALSTWLMAVVGPWWDRGVIS